ncbi:hypothetical protein ScPMuIL_010406 [Solemya velum]
MATVFFLLIVCSVFHNSTPTPTPKYQRWNELIEKYQQWTGFHDHSKGGSIPGDDSKSRVRRAFGPSGASGVGGLGVKANYSDRYRVSERCMNHTEMYISGLLGMQNWAMRMFDAGGKLPSEVMRKNINWMGSYDECLDVVAAIVHNSTDTTTVENPFRGRYCTVSIPFIDLEVLTPEEQLGMVSLTLGVCVPNSCSSSDVKGLISSGLSVIPSGTFSSIAGPMDSFPGIPLTAYAYKAVCPAEEKEWDDRAIASMTVVGLFMVVMLFATAYDYIYLQIFNEGQLKPGRLAQALLSFSVYTNGAKILNTKSPPGNLSCLNGIRFLSMTWVLYGHLYSFAEIIMQGAIAKELIKDVTYQVVANALVSVDTFFALSGLLVTYLSLKEMKRGGMLNMGMFYFHRFWRLTPPFMLVMMVYVALFRYWGDGPFWPDKGLESNYCEDNWWTNLIYLGNFIKTDKQQCMAWVWYLMTDMQMYVVSPLIFIPLFYSKWFGGIVTMTFLLGTTIATGVISKVNHLPPSLIGGDETQDMASYFIDYYIKPYCRMGPYLMGMITGYFLYKTECKVKMNKAVVVFGWLVSTFCALAVLYGLYDAMNGHPLTENVSALFNAVHRTVWGGCVCWVIFACSTGYGGPVNTILSWNALLPLTRLTYTMYLIHPIVISWWALRQRQTFYHTTENMIYLFFGTLIICYAAAFVVSLAFESPFMALEKVIFPKKKRNAQTETGTEPPAKLHENGVYFHSLTDTGKENNSFSMSGEKQPIAEVPNYVEVFEKYSYEDTNIKI